jgi:hypothetical protein
MIKNKIKEYKNYKYAVRQGLINSNIKTLWLWIKFYVSNLWSKINKKK